MKLLVTGATGFVGATVVRRALAAGHSVAALLRDPARSGRLAPFLDDVEVHPADLRDDARVEAAISVAKPDAVIHSAWAGVANSARNDTAQIYENIAPTCRLLELAARGGVSKFVGVGSQGEYGPLNRVISETDRPAPTTLYGVSKLATAMLCEKMAEQLGISFAWLRLFSTYGPGDSDVWMIPSIIGQLLRGERPRTTLGTQLWDYLYIDDVADGILAAAIATEATGLFNLGSGKPVQVRWIIEQLRELVAPDADIGFGEIAFRPDQVMHMEADISRLKRLAHWAPEVEFADGLRRTVDWHRGMQK